MDLLCRFELSESELLDIEHEYAQLIEKIGWGDFFRIFNGHHIEVTWNFDLSLKESVSQIGSLCLVISKDLIEMDMKLPKKGERWFKNKGIIR